MISSYQELQMFRLDDFGNFTIYETMVSLCYLNFHIYILVPVFVSSPKTCPAWLVQQTRTVQPTDADKLPRLAEVCARQGEVSNESVGRLVGSERLARVWCYLPVCRSFLIIVIFGRETS